MVATIKNKLGRVIISEKVLRYLAAESASQAYGIVGLAALNVKDGLFELLGVESRAKGVRISVEDDKLDIELTVIMEYGVRIAVVAENIIEKVKYNIESNTNIEVNSVNVVVQGIRVR